MTTYRAPDGAVLHHDVLGGDLPHTLLLDDDSRGSGLSRTAAVVVLAGGAARDPVYLGDLAGLSTGRRLVVPHLRGVGRSPAPATTEAGAYWRQAADIEALREHLGVETLVIVAHSAGTRLAIAYAAQHADRVGALLLITPPVEYLVDEPSDVDALLEARRGEPALDAALVALAEGPDVTTEDSFNDWHQRIAPVGYAAWSAPEQAHASVGRWSLAAARAYFSVEPPPDLAARLRAVTAPVLVVAGAQDALAGLAPVVALAELFANGSAVVIDHCGHYPWVEQPTDFRRAVDPFLDALGQSGASGVPPAGSAPPPQRIS